MKMVVGLGNPGEKYEFTRHNVGFWLLERYASEHGVVFGERSKFKAATAELHAGNEKVLLVKPLTFYNLSGEAVRLIADFYKVQPQDIVIIHDELALPFGKIRTRLGGSDAGNNGIKSINQHLGPGTLRIRVGIYSDLRDKIDDVDFVLGRFSADEQIILGERVTPKVHQLIEEFLTGRHQPTSHTVDIN